MLLKWKIWLAGSDHVILWNAYHQLMRHRYTWHAKGDGEICECLTSLQAENCLYLFSYKRNTELCWLTPTSNVIRLLFFLKIFLMWTIFKVFFDIVVTLLLFFVLGPWGMWDTSPLTRDWTLTPALEGKSQPLVDQRSPWNTFTGLSDLAIHQAGCFL